MRFRPRHAGVAVILLAVSAGTAALARPEAERPDLAQQLTDRVRTTLEQSDPAQHQHAGHDRQQTAAGTPPVVCGVRVYGHEPAGAGTLAEVRTVYAFHLCGVAEPGTPWDVSVKLAGPVILTMATDPPGIQAVEATPDVKYVDRLRQLFPPQYAEPALREALTEAEMTELRRRYDAAAGL